MTTAARSYAHGAADGPLIDETIGIRLATVAARLPDREALVDCAQRRRFTYAQLDDAVDALATSLLRSGVAVGDRIAIWGDNRWEWVVTALAVARIGAIAVNGNPAYGADELRYLLEHAEVGTLFLSPTFRGRDVEGIAQEAAKGLRHLRDIVSFGSAPWEALRSGIDRDLLADRTAHFDFDDPVSIQYTSGTTGKPKGATLTHHNLLNNAWAGTDRLGITSDARVCVPVPLFHTFGTVFGMIGPVAHGACIVLPSPSFDPGATLEAVEAERCTALYGVPTMYIAQLEHPERTQRDLTSLRTGLIAGAPCPVEVTKRVIADLHVTGLQIGYGMTETSPGSLQTAASDDDRRRIGTVGRVLPHVEVKIADPLTGRVVERGRQGEVCARGYLVMRGYWRDPERTAEAIDEQRWMHTGDLGVMDADGYVNIVGRIKDIVIRGGENIDASEIEDVLYRHPAVAEAHVIGVPDERMGEELMAWIRLRDGSTVEPDELRQHCLAHLARFKAPKYLRLADSFPTTLSGKVQKFALRQMAIEELGLEAAAGLQCA